MNSGEHRKRPQRRPERLRAAYSFVGGSLIGIAVSLTLFLLSAGEGAGDLMLLAALTLASAGIGMHLSASKRTAHRGEDSSLQVKGARAPTDGVNRHKQRSFVVG